MKRKEVKSSLIKSVGYDIVTETLEVEFNDLSVYQYAAVAHDTHQEMMNADSIGAYFSANIKRDPEAYPYTQVQQAPRQGTTKHKKEIAKETVVDKNLIASVAMTMPERARHMVILNNDDYLAAAEFLKSIKALQAEVDEAFDVAIKKAHEAHKTAVAQKKKYEAPLVEAEGIVKRVIAAYMSREEERRKAEEDRIRREREAAIRRQAEEENIKRAQELAEQGRMDEAAKAVDAEVVIPDMPLRVESTLPKVSGLSKRETWKVTTVDLGRLVTAVARGEVPIEAIEANMVFLNAQARAYKKVGEILPGVFVAAEDSIASGR